uniref:Uncharacterized protein n=1 Tax=Oryza nivara TaxID=4536 RepID=A0A0E0HYW2_ORYNI
MGARGSQNSLVGITSQEKWGTVTSTHGCDGLERTKLDKNMHETMKVQSWPHVGITKMPPCHLTQCQMKAQAQISDNVAFE